MEQLVTFIVIYCNKANANTLKEVLEGIEEEGVSFYINQEEVNTDCITLSYKASKMSSVGVGIGINGTSVRLSVQHQMKPFLIDLKNDSMRSIGQNAGRYVKKKPLICH